MKKMITFLAFLCCMHFAISAKPDLRPEAKPNKPLSTTSNFLRNFCDFICLESLGIAALKPENEKFIRDIINELGMQDYCIELRSMSNYAQQGFSLTDLFRARPTPVTPFGRVNIFSLPSIFGRRSHTNIYISEEWFSTLEDQQKEALVKQELMHLKHGHHLKKLGVAIISGLCCGILVGALKRQLIDHSDDSQENRNYIQTVSFISARARDLSIMLMITAYARMCQKKADIEAVKTMDNKEDFIDLLKTMQTQTEDFDSKFSFKRFINTVIMPFVKLLHWKPSFDERIEYIEASEIIK